jgi:hypothetical protein
MSATTTTLHSYLPGWLRSATFDLGYIFGLAAVALLAGAAVVSQPALFPLIVVLDLWLLGYHHVVSTFTRLAFDTESFSQNRFLVLVLPLLVLVAVIIACISIGTWVLPTTYLYWQWFHYMRQSYGISRIYQRKGQSVLALDDRLAKAVIYLIPIWGILYRSYQRPGQFLWMDIKTLPVPFWLVAVAGSAALLSFVWWSFRRLQDFSRGQLTLGHTLYMLSHVTIFTTGYLLISDISQGWLVVNIWHNAQYILLVWMFNNNRFKAGIDPRHRFLSTISQRPKVLRYFLVCLGISTASYVAIYITLTKATAVVSFAAAIPLVLIAYQAINFHHYIVDAVIWKVRKKSLQQGLGIQASAS